MNQFAKRVVVALAVCLVVVQTVAIAQNLGAAPQVNVAVQCQTGAQPEGAFLNFVNWIGNVIAPVGAGVAVLGAVGSYATGRGVFRWLVTAAGLLAISGVTRLIEFWLAQGGGGISCRPDNTVQQPSRQAGLLGNRPAQLRNGSNEWQSHNWYSTQSDFCWRWPLRQL